MPRKCKICGSIIPNSEYETCVPYQNGYVHKSPCFDEAMKALVSKNEPKKNKQDSKKKSKPSPKPKIELKDSMSPEEYQSKKSFFEYIRSFLGENEKVSAKTYVLVTKYIDQYGFDYNSMLLTLKYMREILEKEIEGDGVGLIPYYIDDAKAFNKSVEKIEEQNKGFDILNMYKTNVIKIKPRRREAKQLDITDIVEGGQDD